MEALLFVAASAALLTGLVGLAQGLMPPQRGPRTTQK